MPRRHRYRGSLRRILAAEALEPRLTMDAAPYVISISGEATLEGTSSDYETGAFDSQSRPILGALQNPAAATPNVPYEAINGLDEELRVEAGRSGGNAYSQVGFGYYHDDLEDSIGQPDAATVYAEIRSSAGTTTAYELDGTFIGVIGDSTSNTTARASARIQIFDADCPVIGTPVRGNWELDFRSITNAQEPIPGAANASSTVTIRYYRAVAEGEPLVLAKTITYQGHSGRNLLEDDFELTVGSEIEVVLDAAASSIADASAVIPDFSFTVENVYAKHVGDLAKFTHYVTAGGAVDPSKVVIEYEITETVCYFDLALSGVPYEGSATQLTKFRISPEILETSDRYSVLSGETGLPQTPEEAFSVGRHILVVDGDKSNWQSFFENTAFETLLVHEPGFADEGRDFRGFFQESNSRTLVARSAGDFEDRVELGESERLAFLETSDGSAEFQFHAATPGVLVITSQGDDLVLSYPSFDRPIVAYLGDGNDIFVGGTGSDAAYGGTGNDALLGEGWDVEVTSLTSLFQDMLDLNFTLAAGLVPASGSGDELFGEEGDDFLLGGNGNDHLESGPGQSIIFGDSLKLDASVTIDVENCEFAASLDIVRSGSGNDTIEAGDESTLILGGAGDDIIKGSTAGFSLLFGNAGADTITGRGSIDLIAGGAGDDTIKGRGLLIGDSVEFEGLGSIDLSDIASGLFQAGVEFKGADTGNDTITGSDSFDLIIGGDGDDTIDGGNGLNVVFCDAFELSISIGIDFEELFDPSSFVSILAFPVPLLRLLDVDFSLTGSGADRYTGGSGVDLVLGGAGDDTLYGHGSFDVLIGGAGDDEVDAGPGFSISIGGVAVGGLGNDTIRGGDGADYLESESGNDTFYGFGGDDRIFGGADADTLYGGDGNDKLYGESGNDELYGEDGDDELFGGPGVNVLDGGSGNNTLHFTGFAPVISPLSAVEYRLPGAAAAIAPSASVTDTDTFTFLGGSLQVAVVEATASDLLSVRNQGRGAGQIGFDGSNVTFEGQVFAQASGGAGSSPLTFAFNLNATIDAVQALLRAVSFETATPAPDERTLQVTLNDGEGNDSDPLTVSVAILEGPPANPWHNAAEPRDVDNFGGIIPLDALIIINELTNRLFSDPTTGQIQLSAGPPPYHYDVNNDGYVTAADALAIINYLHFAAQSSGEGEGAAAEPAERTVNSIVELNDQTARRIDSFDWLLAEDVATATRKRRS